MTRIEELIKELPCEIHQKFADILEFLLQKETQQFQSLPKPGPPGLPLEALEKSDFSEKAKRIAMARADLVRLYRRVAARAPAGEKVAAKREFIQNYNLGCDGKIYAILQKTSYASVERWDRKLRKTGNAYDLAPQWGKRKGATSVTPEQACCFEAADPPPHKRPISEVVRVAKKMMDPQGLEGTRRDRTYRRFLNERRKSH